MSGEEDGFVAMDKDAVFEVIAKSARENGVFDILAEADHVIKGVTVANADDILFDDWSGVELFGDVVAGGSSKLDASSSAWW